MRERSYSVGCDLTQPKSLNICVLLCSIFVMREWSKSLGCEGSNIKMISDGNTELSKVSFLSCGLTYATVLHLSDSVSLSVINSLPGQKQCVILQTFAVFSPELDSAKSSLPLLRLNLNVSVVMLAALCWFCSCRPVTHWSMLRHPCAGAVHAVPMSHVGSGTRACMYV